MRNLTGLEIKVSTGRNLGEIPLGRVLRLGHNGTSKSPEAEFDLLRLGPFPDTKRLRIHTKVGGLDATCTGHNIRLQPGHLGLLAGDG